MHDMSYDDKVNKSSGTTSIRGTNHYQRHDHHHQSGSIVLNEGCDPLKSTVSVIVCSYKPDPESIRNLVRALFQQTLRPHEIIIVTDTVPKTHFPFVRQVVNSGTGLSGARNTGVAYATGKYIMFIDDDAVPTVMWIKTMVANMIAGGYDVLGGPVIPTADQMSARKKLARFPPYLWWLIGCTPEGWSRPIGCNMMFRREIFDAYLFDTGLGKHGGSGAVGEETDLINRLLRDGYTVGTTHRYDAAVFHDVPPHRLTGRYLLNRAYMEGYSKARMTVGKTECTMIKRIICRPSILGLAVLFTVGCGYILAMMEHRVFWSQHTPRCGDRL